MASEGKGFSKSLHKVPIKNKARYVADSSMDDGVIEKLSGILAILEEEGASKDYEPLIQFFQKGFFIQVVQSWSYYAQVTSHSKFTGSTAILTSTLKTLGENKAVYEHGDTLISLIMNNHVSVLYKGLNYMKGSITNATIRLLKEMILFNSARHVEEIITNFDFSLPALGKILNVGKVDMPAALEGGTKNSRISMRHEWIDFWLSLISETSPLLRKDVLMDHPKMMASWFRYMDKADSTVIMKRTIDVFVNKILCEPTFKRMTKTKILSELAVSKIHSFYNSSDKELVKKVNGFFLIYGSDPESSVAFPDDCVWFSESPLSGNRKGVMVAINQKQFQVYNKQLFIILKLFKPWEDDMQSTTVCKILNHVPELVAPYTTFLASLGSHDPKMTSYWFGCTMTLGRMIRLEIPPFMKDIKTDISPSTNLVMQSIVPFSLTKQALQKALNHEKLLIRQMASQLIIFCFQKLEKVLELYDQNGWTAAKPSLRNSFHSIIPDSASIAQVIIQTYTTDKNNKILQLSLTSILRLYSKIFPSFFSVSFPSPNIFIDIIHNKSFSGLDLAILDNFLQFQELNGTQMKWWQKNSGAHSLFVSLLMLTVKSEVNVGEKISQLLENMFHGSVVFNKLSCSPQKALVHSLQAFKGVDNAEEMQKIWKILDEAVERSVRTPYKYVDLSREHGYLSPFTMALIEQWNYVEKSTPFTLVSKWLCIYLRTMIICGDSKSGALNLFNEHLKDIPDKYTQLYLGLDNYEKAIQELGKGEYMVVDLIQSSYFDYISMTPYLDLKRVTRYPTNRFDAVGLQFRLNLLVQESKIAFDKYFQDVSQTLVAQLANYNMVDTSFKLMNTGIVIELLQNIENTEPEAPKFIKSLTVMTELIRINNELIDDLSFQNFSYNWIRKNTQFLHHNDKHVKNFVSALCQCFGPMHAISLMELHDEMSVEILNILLKTILNDEKQSISFDIIMALLSNRSLASIQLVSDFIMANKVNEMNQEKLVPLLLTHHSYSPVVHSFLKSQYCQIDAFILHLSEVKDDHTGLLIALEIYDLEDEKVNMFVKSIIKKYLNCFKDLDIERSRQALELFCVKLDLLSVNEKHNLQEYLEGSYKDKYSTQVVAFMSTVADFEKPEVVKWIGKLSLFITKAFTGSHKVGEDLLSLLGKLKDLIYRINLWQKVPSSILNSQLEAILNGAYISNPRVLEYVCHMLLIGDGASIEYAKILQCFLNNESNSLITKDADTYSKYLSSAIILILFQLNPSKCSSITAQNKLLEFYSGTLACHDRIILKILEVLEANISSSWTNEVFMWDLLENTSDENSEIVQLISRKKEGLIVTLDATMIENTTKEYILERPACPTLIVKRIQESWKNIMSFFFQNERSLFGAHQDIYDPTFLLLSAVHNDELVKKTMGEDGATKYIFNVKGFLDSKLFHLMICALADVGQVHEIALQLITEMLMSLEEKSQLKDNNIFKVLLKRIVFTFNRKQVDDVNKGHTISPCIWFAVARLCDILLTPTSSLYEKSYRWVFSCPFIRYNDFPLLQELMMINNPQSSEVEHYYKQLGWVLDCFNVAIKTDSDVELLKKKGVLEWLSNLMNNPYLNAKLHSSINSVFYLIQRVGNSGSIIITRAASISNLEIHKIGLQKRKQQTFDLLSINTRDKKELKKELVFQEAELNICELLEGHSVLIKSQKRLRDWASGDADNIQKRLRS